jgi:hypothetical protein
MTTPTKRKRQSPEKRMQGYVIKNLRRLGFFVSSFSQARASKQTPGIPDLYVMGHGVALWIEMKADGCKLTTAQSVWHREAKENGVAVMVAYNTDDVLAELRTMGVPIT